MAGWVYDSRNRSLFADRGARHRLVFNTTIPGSDIEYYTVNYNYQQYWPVTSWATVLFQADLGYGAAFGNTTSLPPYKNYFGGGPDTVRGFQENSLGPKDDFGNPYGGDTLVSGQAAPSPTARPEVLKSAAALWKSPLIAAWAVTRSP